MIDILGKYLKKIGVTERDDLNIEEKKQFDDWAEALSGRRLTDRDVAKFLISKENEIINKLIDVKISEKEDVYLKVQLDLIRQIKIFLAAPELEKKMTEYTLEELLKN
jgi:hypothetical protein